MFRKLFGIKMGDGIKLFFVAVGNNDLFIIEGRATYEGFSFIFITWKSNQPPFLQVVM